MLPQITIKTLRLLKRCIKYQYESLSKHYNPKNYYEQKYRKTLQQAKFKKLPNIVVEINNTCNLDCLMCSTKQANRPKGNISVKFFEHLIKDVLKPLNQKTAVLHTVGEPLMHPKFDKILGILKRERMRLVITTNALLVDRYISSFYDNRDVFAQINVSIDGASQATYETVRKGGSFDKLMENLALLQQFSQEGFSNIPMTLQCCISKYNLREIPLFYQVYQKYFSTDFLFGFVTNLTATHDEAKFFNDASILPINLSEHMAPCKLVRGQVHILYDGRVSACCRDYNGELIVGDINKEDIMSIWNSSKYAELRKLHQEKNTSQIPLRKDCYAYPVEITRAFRYYVDYIFQRYKGKNEEFYNNKIKDFLLILEKAASKQDWQMLEVFPD